ncbi:MAG TPA: ABC transporter ATP-binding protein [Cellulomonas sp.]|uniref:ABC transporter ATP-binding protein n=1 Tax=Cellulomonas sp. TaxID=40001 RepID=UPI002E2FAE1D|nr:ABC transporter ATP-binding protein [Cellulomonas sp.]HEX5333836.1 ABC transporter ATP-binding protein [Cellulomonas sp.]
MKLPVADGPALRRETRTLLRRHRGALTVVVALHAAAACAGLAGPWLLGRLIDAVAVGTTSSYVDRTVVVLVVAVLAQTVLIRYAQRSAMVLGESVFAELREEFLSTVTRLPLSIVERAGTGDLIARTTTDIDRVQYTVRFGVPRLLVSGATIALTAVAAALTSPLVALGLLAGLPLLLPVARWDLRRAAPAYLRESAAYATLNGTITESVEGARTVDALNLGARRRARVDDDLREAFAAESRTLWLRSILFPGIDASFLLPVVAVLAWGAYLVSTGGATIGAVTTIALYATQIIHPIWELIFWLDEIQVGATSLARILGVANVLPDRTAGSAQPSDEHVVAEAVRYAYREGHDVLHGIDLDLVVGERLAVVGPSGAGKSTLGRMLAGIHPPSGGSVTVGGVPLVELPLGDLRGHVALVTQEHHVFVGTVADNLRLARVAADDAELERALRAVDAWEWVDALPDGLGTGVGSGGVALTPAQAQQLALARLVLLDPHTLVLDEATSLLDPRAARHLERSLSAVLAGRTVVAIAHRLHTAHDADRVAVVDGGRIVEIGSHDELVAAGGDYAALWRSWQQE